MANADDIQRLQALLPTFQQGMASQITTATHGEEVVADLLKTFKRVFATDSPAAMSELLGALQVLRTGKGELTKSQAGLVKRLAGASPELASAGLQAAGQLVEEFGEREAASTAFGTGLDKPGPTGSTAASNIASNAAEGRLNLADIKDEKLRDQLLASQERLRLAQERQKLSSGKTPRTKKSATDADLFASQLRAELATSDDSGVRQELADFQKQKRLQKTETSLRGRPTTTDVAARQAKMGQLDAAELAKYEDVRNRLVADFDDALERGKLSRAQYNDKITELEQKFQQAISKGTELRKLEDIKYEDVRGRLVGDFDEALKKGTRKRFLQTKKAGQAERIEAKRLARAEAAISGKGYRGAALKKATTALRNEAIDASIGRNPLKKLGASAGSTIGGLLEKFGLSGAATKGKAMGAAAGTLGVPLLLLQMLGVPDEVSRRLAASDQTEAMQIQASGQRMSAADALEQLRFQQLQATAGEREAQRNAEWAASLQAAAMPRLTPRETYIGPRPDMSALMAAAAGR